jgi:predicted ABC-type sugar transport system permease subunit
MTTLAAPAALEPRTSWLIRVAQLRAWLFLIVLIIFFEAWTRIANGTSFLFSLYNVQAIAVFAALPLLLGLGQTFAIISAGIDLSLAFVMGLASVVAAHVANIAGEAGMGQWPAMLAGLLAGVAITIIPGLVNGWLIAYLKVPPFIGTLGMYGVSRGAAYLFAGGMTIAIDNDLYSEIGNGRVFGGTVPVIVIVAAVACIILHYMLSQTRFGQHTYAMGASQPAARRRRARRCSSIRSRPSSSAARVCSAARARSGARSPAPSSSPSSSTGSCSSTCSRSGNSSRSAR